MPLARLLSKFGVCSRKDAEQRVFDGRVTVNGRVRRDVQLPVDPTRDEVRVDGAPLRRAATLHLMLHKPRGVVTSTRDERGRRTVMDLLPERLRGAMPVGRLDRDSSGLLLLTNDHDLGDAILGPRSPGKTYEVTVAAALEDAELAPLRAGIELDGRRCLPVAARITGRGVAGGPAASPTTDLELILHEGRNRQIRRSLAALGVEVLTLHRVAIGPVLLGDLPPGAARELRADEVRALRAARGDGGPRGGRVS